ncbi:MAG TPA: PadR family transcriptional regulator [Gemmatimonadaceae bacterium]|jgi:transcriptional regulator|nr:PadR family transcriptional regulator [Gemmatimonadaceae bacterium]
MTPHEGAERAPLPPGTLELLILRTLTLGPLHGYAIAQHIAGLSDGVLQVEQGSLYPALERLLQNGWATAKWGKSPTGRRARYYTITSSGRKRLGEAISAYDRVSLAIGRVLGRA